MSDIVERVREFLALEDDLKDVVVASLTPEQVDTLRAFLRMETSSEKINRLETENSSLRQLLSEADKREREARAKALEEAAKVADEAAAMRERLYQENGASLNASKAAQALVIAANIRALQSEER